MNLLDIIIIQGVDTMSVIHLEPDTHYCVSKDAFLEELFKKISDCLKYCFKRGESHLVFSFSFASPKVVSALHDYLSGIEGLHYSLYFFDSADQKIFFTNFHESSFKDFLNHFITNEIANHPEKLRLEIELNKFNR